MTARQIELLNYYWDAISEAHKALDALRASSEFIESEFDGSEVYEHFTLRWYEDCIPEFPDAVETNDD